MTRSAIYEGHIRHRRFAVRKHEFRHRIAMAYIDLDELPTLLGGRLLERGLVWFRRSDYLSESAVRALVHQRTGRRPEGPVRILANLRSFGHCFNPVSFYYCFAPDGETLEAVVAEVTNTPWGERHAYVQPGTHDKQLHVSPFMPMDQRYTWRAPAPGETLSVHIESHGEGRAFDATLSLRRRALTPLPRGASLRTLGLIYAHALALKLKGVPVQPHPART